MLLLLRRLAAEREASTSTRSWTAKVGLAGGALIEPGRIDLAHPPTIVLEGRRNRVVYTTLRDVVRIELGRGGLPRLEGRSGSATKPRSRRISRSQRRAVVADERVSGFSWLRPGASPCTRPGGSGDKNRRQNLYR